RTEVGPDVLDAHAQRHQVEDGDGEPHIPGPGVDAGAPDGLPRVFGGRPERPESRAEHERRNAEQVGGRVAGPERRGARSPCEAVDAQRQGCNREGRSRREGLVRSFHGEVVDRGERRGVREDGAGVADDGRAGTAHARRPGRAGKNGKRSARRLGGQTDRRSGGQQGDEQADDTTARSSNRPRHWMRMTPSRPTSEERSAPPEGSVKRRTTPAAAASCCARSYQAEPARRVPLRLTALAWLTAGTSGNADGIRLLHVWLNCGKSVRNAQLLYWSAEGAVNPGRSENQLAKAHRLTRSVNDALVCRVTFAAPVNPV